MDPSHNDKTRPQVANGGTASNMEDSCEYTELNSRGQPTKCGPPAWGLGKMLKTPHRKNWLCYETWNMCLGPGLMYLTFLHSKHKCYIQASTV